LVAQGEREGEAVALAIGGAIPAKSEGIEIVPAGSLVLPPLDVAALSIASGSVSVSPSDIWSATATRFARPMKPK
jgi:hypothetical protein